MGKKLSKQEKETTQPAVKSSSTPKKIDYSTTEFQIPSDAALASYL